MPLIEPPVLDDLVAAQVEVGPLDNVLHGDVGPLQQGGVHHGDVKTRGQDSFCCRVGLLLSEW